MSDFARNILIAVAVVIVAVIMLTSAMVKAKQTDGREAYIPPQFASTPVATLPMPLDSHPSLEAVILQCRVGVPK